MAIPLRKGRPGASLPIFERPEGVQGKHELTKGRPGAKQRRQGAELRKGRALSQPRTEDGPELRKEHEPRRLKGSLDDEPAVKGRNARQGRQLQRRPERSCRQVGQHPLHPRDRPLCGQDFKLENPIL